MLGASAAAHSQPTNPYFNNEQYNMAYAAAAAAGHRIPNAAHHLQMERQQHIRQAAHAQQQEQIMQWKRQQQQHKQQQQQQQQQQLQRAAAAAAAHGLHGQQAAHSAPREHHRFGTAHLLAEAMDKAAVSEADAGGSPAMCKACKKEASFMCSACRGAHYCSLECQVGLKGHVVVVRLSYLQVLLFQRKNWVEHSKFCVQRK